MVCGFIVLFIPAAYSAFVAITVIGLKSGRLEFNGSAGASITQFNPLPEQVGSEPVIKL